MGLGKLITMLSLQGICLFALIPNLFAIDPSDLSSWKKVEPEEIGLRQADLERIVRSAHLNMLATQLEDKIKDPKPDADKLSSLILDLMNGLKIETRLVSDQANRYFGERLRQKQIDRATIINILLAAIAPIGIYMFTPGRFSFISREAPPKTHCGSALGRIFNEDRMGLVGRVSFLGVGIVGITNSIRLLLKSREHSRNLQNLALDVHSSASFLEDNKDFFKAMNSLLCPAIRKLWAVDRKKASEIIEFNSELQECFGSKERDDLQKEFLTVSKSNSA